MLTPVETSISNDSAEVDFAVSAKHGLMWNGEKRFRLSKTSEGSGYIRTESSTSGSWQNAHYHEQVRETYIVQSGWIVACELLNADYIYNKYNEGDVFTTSPNVVHNIYMSANTVIHTVKHGRMPSGKSTDRIEKDFEPERMTTANRALGEAELLTLVERQKLIKTKAAVSSPVSDPSSLATVPTPVAALYNDEYRHFDNLIWQTPAWSVAVLTIAFVGASSMKDDGAIAAFLKLPKDNWSYLPSSVFLCMGLFLVLLSYILYRFRWHQAGTVPQKPKSRFLKSQALLQLFISLEALALLGVALWGFGLPVQWLFSGLVVLLLSLHYALETSVFSRACENTPLYTPS